jgi:hypothetical protein
MCVKELLDCPTHLLLLEQEAIVAVEGVDPQQRRLLHVLVQEVLLVRGVEQVTGHREQERGLGNASKHLFDRAVALEREVVAVHDLGEGDVGEGVEAVEELLALLKIGEKRREEELLRRRRECNEMQ